MWFPLEFFQFHIDITFFIIAVIYLFAFIKSRMFSSLLFLWEYFQQSQAILERKKNWCHSLILGFREQSHFLQLFLKSVVHLSHMASSYIQSVSARARHDIDVSCTFATVYDCVCSLVAIEMRGTVQNESAVPLVEKFFRISRWQQQSVKPSVWSF